jgi:hypothetical protein
MNPLYFVIKLSGGMSAEVETSPVLEKEKEWGVNKCDRRGRLYVVEKMLSRLVLDVSSRTPTCGCECERMEENGGVEDSCGRSRGMRYGWRSN